MLVVTSVGNAQAVFANHVSESGLKTALPRLVADTVFKWSVHPLRFFSKTHPLLLQMLSSKENLRASTRTVTNRGRREGKYDLRAKGFKLPSCTTRPEIHDANNSLVASEPCIIQKGVDYCARRDRALLLTITE